MSRCRDKMTKINNNSSSIDIKYVDSEITDIIKQEKERQCKGLELIAAQNFTSKAVAQAMGSCLMNDGDKTHRSDNMDKIEKICQKRALELFKLDPEEWGVNVHSLSGSIANLVAYTAIAGPHGKIMGLDLFDGGHYSHGFHGSIDDTMATSIKLHYSGDLFINTSRDLDYRRFRDICDDVGAYLLGDMAHVCGLVAAGLAPSPFDFCDIVTTTTYKSLRGPRAGLIFFRKAVAVSLKEAMSPDFIFYQKQILANAKALCTEIQTRGYSIATGGTDNHMVIIELDTRKVNANQAATVLEDVGLYVNKKLRPSDKDKTKPSGLRIGSPALTSRSFKEHHFTTVADFIDRAIKIAEQVVEVCGRKEGKFKEELFQNPKIQANVNDLRTEIENFAMQFPMPGIKGW
ncbi:hypothetical protein KUTeg_004286 [Tegillarca granosa]|uniref:glycine hydroxymethyltransferase n=1 Tax=Tegillarca granosa TaxID=220873 RepID=A0ABQ9FSD8_TEGGR|nr:hypothetical protein KUTeg_004286 [Tegillarca granosa]